MSNNEMKKAVEELVTMTTKTIKQELLNKVERNELEKKTYEVINNVASNWDSLSEKDKEELLSLFDKNNATWTTGEIFGCGIDAKNLAKELYEKLPNAICDALNKR